MAIQLLAKPLVEKTKKQLEAKCKVLKEKDIIPKMQVIYIGDNKASRLYTRKKKKFCENFGAIVDIIHLPSETTEKEFLETINNINLDKTTHGCFIQLPVPTQLEHLDVGELISPKKDVDGFHAENLRHLMRNSNEELYFTPCTPGGIMSLLSHYEIPVEGKNVVIVGRSMIVGKPLSLLMTNHNATVTVCHSKTNNLREITRSADIIVSAVGKPRYLDASYINNEKDQVVIDVGINHDQDGILCGDINFNEVEPLVYAITPVPGGVGPLTVLYLAQNLLQAAEKNI